MSNARKELAIQKAAAEKRRKQIRSVIIIAIALAVIAAVAVAVIVFQRATADDRATPTDPNYPPNATADGRGMVLNPGKFNSNAPEVALYFDYQCPWCKRLEAQSGAKLLELAQNGEIQLQYRTLTFLDAGLHNDSSQRAAEAATCADFVGVYSQFHDAIFANQPEKEGEGYSEELLTKTIPAQAGLSGDNLTKWQQCYSAKKTEKFVQTMSEYMYQDGVKGSPALYVNGKQLENPASIPPDQLAQRIQELAQQ